MLVKVSELEGRELDWAVGLVEFGKPEYSRECGWHMFGASYNKIVRDVVSATPMGQEFNPSGNWAHGGPLIDKYAIELMFLNCPKTAVGLHRVTTDNGILICAQKRSFTASADTSILVPVCRAVVYSKHSYEIEIPDELVEA